MCIKYKTVFTNKYFTENSEVSFYDEKYGNYISPMILRDIVIDTEGFEVLSIDYNEYFNHKNLCEFDYEIMNGVHILKSYELKVFIPIKIIDKRSGNENKSEMIIDIKNDNNKKYQKLRVFDKEIVIKDYAYTNLFEKIYDDIKDKYAIKICAYCKKSFWDPYGGNNFIHQVCFKNIFDEFNKIETKNKNSVGYLMAINKNFMSVLLTECCKEYEEK